MFAADARKMHYHCFRTLHVQRFKGQREDGFQPQGHAVRTNHFKSFGSTIHQTLPFSDSNKSI